MNLSLNLKFLLLSFCFIGIATTTFAQSKKNKDAPKHYLDDYSLSALKYRSIGPSMTSGRISDFAVNPNNFSEYYVATSSGGVWKTINAGTTYTPIFDQQGSYSIGCISIDPSDENTIWVGTGENNNQRSVAYGDGIYKSTNKGKSWTHMGLKDSEHIANVLIHPKNSDIILVSAIGPLWNKGGDRGVYRSIDGGSSWTQTLKIDAHTGVTDMVMDPSNPNILYAATFQRARHVYTYLGGGPGSSIYKSVDNGETWNEIKNGLPKVELGRIGLTISPANPSKIYAIVEAAKGKSGFYQSTNGGTSWEKQGSYVTSGNYYQEIIADPINPEIIYGMDTWLHRSINGGKTFSKVGENTKHVDNHCIWINPTNNKHWLVGCDGGIYETWDEGVTWDFKSNLPVTQFYKVAVDNAKPFYHIYGGTQDNFSLGGPSRTQTAHGIVNSDWYITHGGDGFESQADPENPNIIYAQSQYGVLVRYDKLSGEEVGIQPKERADENGYRWNWDAPLIASPHATGRIYFAANKVFRSDDRGNSWTVISDDLTSQLNRNELKIMGKIWSIDAVNKNRSTSPYGTIVAMAESSINENLLVIGTDDGVIQITENGGDSWKKVSSISGAPKQSYVNAVYTSQHDENVIYAIYNHHKFGDFKPYVFKSINKGSSWTNISNNLPKRGSVYSIEEDHIDKNLLFVGTEFSAFFSNDGGKRWNKLSTGLPTIAVRDIAIQRDQNDLILGTFGRGFYVLDDYSPLRSVSESNTNEAMIFDVRDAYIYEKSKPLGLNGKSFQGDSFYSGQNLGPVATIYYNVAEEYKSIKKEREEKEKEANAIITYPSYDDYKLEKDEVAPKIIFTIKNENGDIVRKLYSKPSKGLQKITWDLRFAPKDAIDFSSPSFYNPFAGDTQGVLVAPGAYTVQMQKLTKDGITILGKPQNFALIPLNNSSLPTMDSANKLAFQKEVTDLGRSMEGAQHLIREMNKKIKYMLKAVEHIEKEDLGFTTQLLAIKENIKSWSTQLNGDPLKTKLDIDQPPSPQSRIGWISYEQSNSTSDPTETHKMSFAIAKKAFGPILKGLNKIATEDIPSIEQKLEDADAPYTPGRAIQMMQGN